MPMNIESLLMEWVLLNLMFNRDCWREIHAKNNLRNNRSNGKENE